MTTVSVETICQDFRNAISSVVDDEEFVVNLNLTADSIISQDLQIDSVEFVRTFDYFLQKYPDAPFVEWFSGLDIETIQSLTVKDFAAFLGQYY